MINFKHYYHALCESQERDIQVVYINVRSINDLDNGENCVSNIHDYKCADDTDFLWDAAENDDLDRYAKNFNNYTDAIEGLRVYLAKAIDEYNDIHERHKNDEQVAWYREPFPKTVEEIIRSVQYSTRGISSEFGTWKLRVYADHDYNIFGIELDPIVKKQRVVSSALNTMKDNTSFNKLFNKK